MEPKEYKMHLRPSKIGERVCNNNSFQGYRTTKQWVEQASQQSRGIINQTVDQQLNQCDHLNQCNIAARMTSTSTKFEFRKKDKRGVRFKQENKQTRLASNVAYDDLLPPSKFRKDCFPASQAAALSPISLNVAAEGRLVASAISGTKQSPTFEALPEVVKEAQSQFAEVSSDIRALTFPPRTDEEGNQVVWCNAAFEADDHLRNYKFQESARSPRLSSATCSKLSESDVSSHMRRHEQTVVSRANSNSNACTDFVPAKLSLSQTVGITSPSVETSAASLTRKSAGRGVLSLVKELVGTTSSRANMSSSAFISASALDCCSPVTALAKSPQQDSLPHIARLELEATSSDWFVPFDSEATSQSSRGYSGGPETNQDSCTKRKTLAAMPSFAVAEAPPFLPNSNRREDSKIYASARDEVHYDFNHRKFPKGCPEALSSFASPGRINGKKLGVPRSVTPLMSISVGNSQKSARRTEGRPVWCGKVDHRALLSTRSSQKQQNELDVRVEADLEEDIDQEIEQEIAKEILHLSQRLAVLHAKQETRRCGLGLERQKSGGISCPQTPLRQAPSPSGSDSGNKRRGRVVASKFLKNKNNGSNVKYGPEKCVTRNDKSFPNVSAFSDGSFVNKANPPRRSLGTPSRLLAKGRVGGQQINVSPKILTVPPSEFEVRLRGRAASRVTAENDVRDFDRGMSGGESATEVLSRNRFREVEPKNSIAWTDIKTKQKEDLSVSMVSAVAASQCPFYPEFERRVDWVKTLRTSPLPATHFSGTTSFQGQALPEAFLKQKSVRQDIHAWLRENVVEAEGNGEISSSEHLSSRCGINVASKMDDEIMKMSRKMDEDRIRSTGDTPARCIRTGNDWIVTPARNGRNPTPFRPTQNNVTPTRNHVTPTRNHVTPTRHHATLTRTTPSSSDSRTVPSRYGTPIKKSSGKPVMESPILKICRHQGTNHRRSGDTKGGLSSVTAHPTVRLGYPGASGVKTPWSSSVKSKGGDGNRGEPLCLGEGPKFDRKITVVEAEYETFVEEGVKLESTQLEESESQAKSLVNPGIAQVVLLRRQSLTEKDVGNQIASSAPELIVKRGDECQPPGSSSGSDLPKNVSVRYSDLIKDKHHLRLKDKQRCTTGQSVLPPSNCQDSDDSVFPRSVTNRTDSSEVDERSEASIVEESSCFERIVGDFPLVSEERASFEGNVRDRIDYRSRSQSLEFDVVYDYESGNQRKYLPEDYTLEMMLQYVDTLKSEREGLPRIRANKDIIFDKLSPRDSGCIKRTREGGRRARYFKASRGECSQTTVTNTINWDNEELSPNEIEGLDLESFWCLVGDLEEPNMISHA